MPTIINRLKHEAKVAATTRGHIMGEFEMDGRIYIADCIHCQRQAVVIPRPRANETTISGEAVALDCAQTRVVPRILILSSGGRYGVGQIEFTGGRVEGDLNIARLLLDLEVLANLEMHFRMHNLTLVPEPAPLKEIPDATHQDRHQP